MAASQSLVLMSGSQNDKRESCPISQVSNNQNSGHIGPTDQNINSQHSGHIDQHNLDLASKSHLLQNCQRACPSYTEWVGTDTMAPNVINREQSLDSNLDSSSPTEPEKSTRKHHNPMPIIVIMAPDNAFDHLLPEAPQYSSYPLHCSQERYWRSKKATFLFCIVIMVLLALFCITIIATTNIVRQVVRSEGRRGPRPLIQTSCGPVEGEYQDGSWVFRGIPYAMPPVGPERWKPPSSNQMPNGRCWEETHMATSYPSVCFQMNQNNSKAVGSEDCLYLNVWMPQSYGQKKPKLPVVVMMQGERQSFHKDTPQKSFEFIRHYVNKAQAVFVSVNYRLDVFGFLASQNFSGKQSMENVTGNFGLMDQIMALHWIQKNIEHFGGNYSEVTVYGESSGTEAMLGLLTSPKATGLFQRMLAINPAFLPIKSFPQAIYANNGFLSHIGCHGNAECLMLLKGEEIMMASSAHRLSNHNGFKEMLPDDYTLPLIIDGQTLVSAVDDRAQIKEKGPEVPVMIGFSNWHTPCAADHLDRNFNHFVQSKFRLNSQSAEEIIQMYTQQNKSEAEILEEMLFDLKMCQAQKMLSNANFPVYYSIVSPHSTLKLQVDQDDKENASSPISNSTTTTATPVNCSRQDDKGTLSLFLSELQQLWKEGFSLIKTGRPSTSKVPNTTALISDNVITIEANYHQRECAFWSQHKIV